MSLDATHSTLTKKGKIVISHNAGKTKIDIRGFSGDGCTCRDVAVLACVWALGELQREIEATIQEPGGGIGVINP